METTPPRTLNFISVYSTSKKFIFSDFNHSLTLPLFFLPLSFSIMIISPTLGLDLVSNLSRNPSNHQKLIISYLITTLIVNSLSLCSIGTITFSTHHSFLGVPVKIIDSFKSLIFSFLPLASTAIIAYVLIFFFSLCFLLFVGTLLMLAHNIGFVINYNSLHFMWFSAIMSAILIVIIIYFHVQWSLAFVVVVVESKWGFSALTRSAYLIKGMRSVSLLVMLYFGVFVAGTAWIWSANYIRFGNTMLGSYFIMMILRRFVAANTVLYNYCKALHGELAIEVPDHDYMNLGVDDEKVPHVVA